LDGHIFFTYVNEYVYQPHLGQVDHARILTSEVPRRKISINQTRSFCLPEQVEPQVFQSNMHILQKKLAMIVAAFVFFLRETTAFVGPRVPSLWTSSSSSTLVSLSSSAPQILEFVEPKTGVQVILVGSMHYNPTSVQLARETIEGLGMSDRLGSVIIEACDIRWNKTAELYAEKPFLKKILSNEMRVACDTAMGFQRPVILGDQRINVTVDALKASLKQTVKDILTPPTGWSRFYDEVRLAWDETVPFGGEGYLNAMAFFDPRLLLVLPVSLIKYPLSYLVRDPVPTTVILTLLGVLSFFDDPTSMESLLSSSEESTIPISDWFLSFGLAALETAIFARLLLKPLLAERNEILAQSILDQCRMYASTNQNNNGNNNNNNNDGSNSKNDNKNNKDSQWMTSFQNPISDWLGSSFFSRSKVSQSTNLVDDESPGDMTTIMYVPGSSFIRPTDGPDKVVVAVLGMAHCNGIKRLLTTTSEGSEAE